MCQLRCSGPCCDGSGGLWTLGDFGVGGKGGGEGIAAGAGTGAAFWTGGSGGGGGTEALSDFVIVVLSVLVHCHSAVLPPPMSFLPVVICGDRC